MEGQQGNSEFRQVKTRIDPMSHLRTRPDFPRQTNAPYIPQEKQKSKTPVIILLAIFFVILAGCGGFYFGNVLTKDKSSCPTCQNVVSEGTITGIDLSLADVRKLMDKFVKLDYNVTSTNNNIFENGLTDQYKYYIALQEIDYNNKVTATHNESGVLDGNFADKEYGFTYDEINEAYHNLFGSDSNVIEQKDFWCSVPFYSEEYNKYISNSRCGGLDPSTYSYEILDYNEEGDALKVKVAYLRIYTDYDGGTTKKTIKLNSGTQELENETANDLKTYLNNLPTYIFTFKTENGKTVLSSITHE